jgi:molybdate transport system substrate-binding protein
MTVELDGVSSMATRLILEALSQQYEAGSGVRVRIRSMGGVDAAKLVRAGEETDVVILASKPMAQLEAEGHLLAGSVKPFARSGMAIAVPDSSPLAALDSEEAVKRAVLGAQKTGYSTGPSGDHFLSLCERWGVPEDRLLKAPPGVPVGKLVAEGQADLGFQQLSELIHVPGLRVVGPLPPEIQSVTIFSAGVCSRSKAIDETRRLIDYLVSPDTDALKRQEGMEAPTAG